MPALLVWFYPPQIPEKVISRNGVAQKPCKNAQRSYRIESGIRLDRRLYSKLFQGLTIGLVGPSLQRIGLVETVGLIGRKTGCGEGFEGAKPVRVPAAAYPLSFHQFGSRFCHLLRDLSRELPLLVFGANGVVYRHLDKAGCNVCQSH